MVTPRSIRDEGHTRKFLAVVDETPECERAVAYAARRAQSTGGALVLLFVIRPGDFQHWLGVEEIMRAEATEAARNALESHAARIRDKNGISPELVIREGTVRDEIHGLIDEDRDIAILILAAGDGDEGPGPLVQSIAGKSAPFPVPVTVIPPNLSDDDIAILA